MERSQVAVFSSKRMHPVGRPVVLLQTEVWPRRGSFLAQAVGFFTEDTPGEESDPSAGRPFVMTESMERPHSISSQDWPAPRLHRLAVKTMKEIAERELSDRYAFRRLRGSREAEIDYTPVPAIELEEKPADHDVHLFLFSLTLSGLDRAHLDEIAGHSETWDDIKALVRRMRGFTKVD